jgi:hypothetical protein
MHHHLEQFVLFCFSVTTKCACRTVVQQWIIPCLYFAAGTYVWRTVLAIDLRSGSTIPAFRRCLLKRCLAMIIFFTILYTTLFPGFATTNIFISSFCVKARHCDVTLYVLFYMLCVQFTLTHETCSPISQPEPPLSMLHSV